MRAGRHAQIYRSLRVINVNVMDLGGSMKRKPDSMVALVFLFCLGLAATGFASMLSDDEPRIGHNIVVQADIKD